MTTASASDEDMHGAAFLDTNALVFLFNLWEAAKVSTIRLDGVSDWPGLKQALETAGVSSGTLNNKNSEHLKWGLELFHNLNTKSGSYQYLSSHVAWSELHHVLLADLSMERMILRRVPRSVRVKRPQMLFRAALEEQDYTELRDRLSSFREELKLEYGLDVITVEDQSAGLGTDPRDIWQIAEAVWSHVLIETLDAYLYASAIAGGASVFVTSDASLRDALQKLWQPQGNWMDLVKSLKVALEEVLSLEKGALELPQPIGLRDPLPTVPGNSP